MSLGAPHNEGLRLQPAPDGGDKCMDKSFADAMNGFQELPSLLQQFSRSQDDMQRELNTSLENLTRRLTQFMHMRSENGSQVSDQGGTDDGNIHGNANSLDETHAESGCSASASMASWQDPKERAEDLHHLHLAQNWESHAVLHCSSDSSNRSVESHKPRLCKGVEMNFILDIASGILVVMNAISIVMELEWRGVKTAGDLQVGPPKEFSQRAQTVFSVLEKTFCILFLLEMVLRFHGKGLAFFLNIWNFVDILVVVISIVDEFVLQTMGVGMVDVKLLRAFRLTRLAKAARVMRIIKFVDPLRVLLVCIVSSVASLFWAMVLVTVIQSIAAVLITQIVNEFLTDDSYDLELRQEVYQWFGRWSSSMLTMFELTLSPGAWAKPGRLLMFKVDAGYALFFIPYVWGVSFAIIRVTSAMFVSQTMSATSKDEDLVFQAALKKHDKEVKQIRYIFETADQSGERKLSIQDFNMLFKDHRMKMWMKDLGLEVSEVSGLFRLMDDGDGMVTFEEFLSGLLRLRGGAKSIDLATLLYENRRVISRVEALRRDVISLRDGQTRRSTRRVDIAETPQRTNIAEI